MEDRFLNVASNIRLDNASFEFIGKKNLWIEDCESAIPFARFIISESIKNTAVGQLDIVAYDSDLSGVFSPFSMFTSGETKVLKILDNEDELYDYLLHVKRHIIRVQNIIQGQSNSLTEFRNATGQLIESYKLIILKLDIYVVENINSKLSSLLSTLLRVAPQSGVCFILISPVADVQMLTLIDNFVLVRLDGQRVTVSDKTREFRSFYPLSKVIDIINQSKLYSDKLRELKLPTVNFNSIHDNQTVWGNTSVNGISFFVGRYGLINLSITIGDEINQRHNILITEAVGQGKSNLLSFIIHSICYRYSPNEVQLYLLDFKEGVTLKVFSNIDKEDFLPHAKILGLESDVEYGLSVFKHLFKIYKERMSLFKKNNTKNIKEFRTVQKNEILPRIVVVIDEFQMMFKDNKDIAEDISELLEKSMRLFRAAGIHFILASQSITGNIILEQRSNNIFAQVPIRIAHKNSLRESQMTLSIGNSEATYLKPREAIVNLDYGEISQNLKVMIGYADESILESWRRRFWLKARDSSPPLIFIPNETIHISDYISQILQDRGEKRHHAVLGMSIGINKELIELPFSKESGSNVVIIGTTRKSRSSLGILESIMVSLMLRDPIGESNFIIVNCIEDSYQHNLLVNLLQRMRASVEVIDKSHFSSYIESLVSNFSDSDISSFTEKRYIVGIGLDSWENDQNLTFNSSLEKLLLKVGLYNTHFIGWWKQYQIFEKQMSYNALEFFNTKIVLNVNKRVLSTFVNMGNSYNFKGNEENKALLCDDLHFLDYMKFIPFSPMNNANYSKFNLYF